jgi:hypothetical protein
MHNGCGVDSETHPLPESVEGCHLVFHGTGGRDLDAFDAKDLDYSFQNGKVIGDGSGGTFTSQSYSYSKPKIRVVWGATATEDITIAEDMTFDYEGHDGSITYLVNGTFKVISGCEALR